MQSHGHHLPLPSIYWKPPECDHDKIITLIGYEQGQPTCLAATVAPDVTMHSLPEFCLAFLCAAFHVSMDVFLWEGLGTSLSLSLSKELEFIHCNTPKFGIIQERTILIGTSWYTIHRIFMIFSYLVVFISWICFAAINALKQLLAAIKMKADAAKIFIPYLHVACFTFGQKSTSFSILNILLIIHLANAKESFQIIIHGNFIILLNL